MNRLIDPYSRFQKGLTFSILFPKMENGLCSCGCGNKVSGKRKKWFSDDCRVQSLNQFYIIKGDTKIIRLYLWERDKGFCSSCGILHTNWQADHIIPVFKGGGGCDLSNFQTLCPSCHLEKTLYLDTVPNCDNILASGIYMIPSPLNTCRTSNKVVIEDIVRNI